MPWRFQEATLCGRAFQAAGAITVNGLAKWNGNGWSSLGSGFDALCRRWPCRGKCVRRGQGFRAGVATGVAKWNGSSWSRLDWVSVVNQEYEVYALAVSGSNVYVGGDFFLRTADGHSSGYVGKWDGNSWSGLAGLGGVPGAYVRALAVSGNDLYAGGFFTAAGRITAYNIAKWNGSDWAAFSSGVDGVVWALAVSGGALYMGRFHNDGRSRGQ